MNFLDQLMQSRTVIRVDTPVGTMSNRLRAMKHCDFEEVEGHFGRKRRETPLNWTRFILSGLQSSQAVLFEF